ncbi:MAG TPA: hypothetical protein VNQ55_12040 [Parapedobacter sp.]|nr:hypothetical protein [Parapedobacter sp.]
MTIIVVAIVGGIGLFILLGYATIKTKSTGLDTYPPFSEWVGKTVTLHRQTTVFEERITAHTNGGYPYLLLDSLHPQWQYVEQRLSAADPDLVKVAVLPAGTSLTLKKALQYTNGVSGTSYPTFFGTISVDGAHYAIAYPWGERSLSRHFDGIDECWQFNAAPWQTAPDTAYYALPEARFW